MRKFIDFITFNWWFEIKERDAPKWVRKAAEDFYSKKGVRPYNKIIWFNGKNHVYKIWFEAIGFPGNIKWHYYKKKRTYVKNR